MYSDFDSSDPEDFVKTILSWSLQTFGSSLSIALKHPALPKREENIRKYYHNFMPFILEESRAIIAEGLEKVSLLGQASRKSQNKKKVSHLKEAKPFNLTLKKKPRFPQNEGNPLSMVFTGAIPEEIEHGRSMNALLLKTNKNGAFSEKQFLALASANADSTELFLKIILPRSDFEEYHLFFQENVRWHAHYLGSLISEERMYDACLAATDTLCIRQIARSQIPALRFIVSPAGLPDLNLSQKRAVSAFMNAAEQSTLLLQGPPGTGKTTTLVSLLKEVAQKNKRVLVSAHSNKGVQVLALRALKDIAEVPMILVGVEGKIPPELKPIFLNRWHDLIVDYLSVHPHELELLAEGKFSEVRVATQDILLNIENNIQFALQQLNKFGLVLSKIATAEDRQKLFELSANPFFMADFERLQQLINLVRLQSRTKEKWLMLQDALILLKDKWIKIKRYSLEKYLLNYAKIVFATLITAGRDSMLDMNPIDFLLVDEAAQSVEAATLIPMRYKPRKVLLVGDTKQLPATVISKVLDDAPRDTEAKNYKWSMMWRLIEENRQPSLMLTEQYRMHPHICQWPSSQYYGDRLITSPKILPVKRLSDSGITSRPYAVYQVSGQDVQDDFSHSICNAQEANYVIKIIGLIRRESSDANIGVITPYVAQKRLISEHLHREKHLLQSVDVNTVDGFQGDERDIIIISFTRTHVSQFLKEFRRLNVAITRPKLCLIILGSPSLLSGDIKQMIDDAKMRNLLYSEMDLKNILLNKMVSAGSGESSASGLDLRLSAWQGDADSQFMYAQRIESIDQVTAFIWYRRSAENEHAGAQHRISQVYLSGNEFTEKDVWLGILWLQKSACRHYPQAQYDFAMHYLEGKIIAKSIANAIHWAELAAKNDHLYAILFLAKCYEEGILGEKNEVKSQQYYRKAAKLGNTDAMLKLAGLLSKGTNDNKREAVKCYRKLAQDGYFIAYYPLAELLSHVLNNQAEALIWYVKAADAGHPQAQFEVGQRLKGGLYGSKVNIYKAMIYLRLAAIGGHVEAQFIYAMALKEGDGIAANEEESIVFLKKAADNGHVEAQYQYAQTKPPESVEGYSYYRKAAKQNHGTAQYICIVYQIKFNCDLAESLEFCQKLAINGNLQIQFVYARLLHSGIAGRIDIVKAFHYYSLLAKGDHAEAQYYCGLILEEGAIGIAKNLPLARYYYEQCAEQVPLARLRLSRLLLQDNSDEIDYNNAIKMLLSFCDSYQLDTQRSSLILEQQLEYLIKKNNKFSLSDFIASIETSSPQANYVLGMMFKAGKKVIENNAMVIKFLKKAIHNGHTEALYQYALLREKESIQEAYVYYKKAAKKNHVLSQYACIRYQLQFKCDLVDCLGFCEQRAADKDFPYKFILARLLDSGIAGITNKAGAYYYYSEAAKEEHKLAYFYCANMLAEGNGIDKNLSLALDYYLKCSNYYYEAKLRCAFLLLEYRDYSSDIVLIAEKEKKAVEFLQIYYEEYQDKRLHFLNAAEKNIETMINQSYAERTLIKQIRTQSVEANYYLGRIFEEGKGVPIDVERALYHYRHATACSDAYYRMGYIHEFGIGAISRNKELARGFYQCAADEKHELAIKRLTWSYSLFSMFSDVSDSALLEEKKEPPLVEKKEDNCLIM